MYYRTYDIDTLMTLYIDRYGAVYADIGDAPFEDVPSADEAMAMVRDERKRRLEQCDWTQLGDVPLLPAQVTQWRIYRQALRDMTQGFAWNVTTWPVPPSDPDM
jgi:hypothetical protein